MENSRFNLPAALSFSKQIKIFAKQVLNILKHPPVIRYVGFFHYCQHHGTNGTNQKQAGTYKPSGYSFQKYLT
jgi:hypothetical protein